MKNFYNELKELLRKHNLGNWDTGKLGEGWNHFEVDHSIDWNEATIQLKKEEVKLYIKTQVQGLDKNKKKGLYIYFDNNRCLYVGKSIDIAGRIFYHYETFLNGNESDWREFFRDSENKKKLTVYFKGINLNNDNEGGEALRVIIERLLITMLTPDFEEYHRNRRKEKRAGNNNL